MSLSLRDLLVPLLLLDHRGQVYKLQDKRRLRNHPEIQLSLDDQRNLQLAFGIPTPIGPS